MKTPPRERGFTLLELLFILVVITILVGIGVNQYTKYREMANDAMAKDDLQKAQKAATLFFMDHPDGRVTKRDLEAYGFTGSANVDLQIFNSTPSGLLIGSAHTFPGSHIFLVNGKGTIDQANSALTSNTSIGRLGVSMGSSGEHGGITPPATNESSSLTKLQLEMAYAAALSYFAQNPEGEVTKNALNLYGYSSTTDVNLTIADGTLRGLTMMATSFESTGQTYLIDSTGRIY
jgi:type II secretory pathway pseudopilin PulG